MGIHSKVIEASFKIYLFSSFLNIVIVDVINNTFALVEITGIIPKGCILLLLCLS